MFTAIDRFTDTPIGEEVFETSMHSSTAFILDDLLLEKQGVPDVADILSDHKSEVDVSMHNGQDMQAANTQISETNYLQTEVEKSQRDLGLEEDAFTEELDSSPATTHSATCPSTDSDTTLDEGEALKPCRDSVEAADMSNPRLETDYPIDDETRDFICLKSEDLTSYASNENQELVHPVKTFSPSAPLSPAKTATLPAEHFNTTLILATETRNEHYLGCPVPEILEDSVGNLPGRSSQPQERAGIMSKVSLSQVSMQEKSVPIKETRQVAYGEVEVVTANERRSEHGAEAEEQECPSEQEDDLAIRLNPDMELFGVALIQEADKHLNLPVVGNIQDAKRHLELLVEENIEGPGVHSDLLGLLKVQDAEVHLTLRVFEDVKEAEGHIQLLGLHHDVNAAEQATTPSSPVVPLLEGGAQLSTDDSMAVIPSIDCALQPEALWVTIETEQARDEGQKQPLLERDACIGIEEGNRGRGEEEQEEVEIQLPPQEALFAVQSESEPKEVVRHAASHGDSESKDSTQASEAAPFTGSPDLAASEAGKVVAEEEKSDPHCAAQNTQDEKVKCVTSIIDVPFSMVERPSNTHTTAFPDTTATSRESLDAHDLHAQPLDSQNLSILPNTDVKTLISSEDSIIRASSEVQQVVPRDSLDDMAVPGQQPITTEPAAAVPEIPLDVLSMPVHTFSPPTQTELESANGPRYDRCNDLCHSVQKPALIGHIPAHAPSTPVATLPLRLRSQDMSTLLNIAVETLLSSEGSTVHALSDGQQIVSLKPSDDMALPEEQYNTTESISALHEIPLDIPSMPALPLSPAMHTQNVNVNGPRCDGCEESWGSVPNPTEIVHIPAHTPTTPITTLSSPTELSGTVLSATPVSAFHPFPADSTKRVSRAPAPQRKMPTRTRKMTSSRQTEHESDLANAAVLEIQSSKDFKTLQQKGTTEKGRKRSISASKSGSTVIESTTSVRNCTSRKRSISQSRSGLLAEGKDDSKTLEARLADHVDNRKQKPSSAGVGSGETATATAPKVDEEDNAQVLHENRTPSKSVAPAQPTRQSRRIANVSGLSQLRPVISKGTQATTSSSSEREATKRRRTVPKEDDQETSTDRRNDGTDDIAVVAPASSVIPVKRTIPQRSARPSKTSRVDPVLRSPSRVVAPKKVNTVPTFLHSAEIDKASISKRSTTTLSGPSKLASAQRTANFPVQPLRSPSRAMPASPSKVTTHSSAPLPRSPLKALASTIIEWPTAIEWPNAAPTHQLPIPSLSGAYSPERYRRVRS